MSLSPETMMDLMAYADGELDTSARSRVEELLRSNDEARRVVAAMGTLGDVVRSAEAERGLEAADGIVDDVMATIAREDVTRPALKKVVPITAARSPRTGAYAAAALVALAAGVLLVLQTARPGPAIIVDDHGMPSAAEHGPVAQSPTPSAVATVDSESQGVDLEEAESAHGKVDVFFTPSPAAAGAVASVVVWIDDRHGGH